MKIISVYYEKVNYKLEVPDYASLADALYLVSPVLSPVAVLLNGIVKKFKDHKYLKLKNGDAIEVI